MRVFPVVERELREASRRRGTYLVRFLSATVAIIIAGWILLFNRDNGQISSLSRGIFGSLSIFAFIYCLFAGVRNTADCISEEKREGTLGLLFLTDLKSFEILFGKLAATSLNSLYGLVALFPVLALPLLLGGTTFEVYGVMLLVLLNTLFLSLVVGICVSTFVHGERAAMALTIGLMAYICGGWTGTGWLLFEKMLGWHTFFQTETAESVFGWVSPVYGIAKLFDSLNSSGISDKVWSSLCATNILSWCFVLVAQRKLPTVWQDKADTVRKLRWRERLRLWSHGDSNQRAEYRLRLLDASPTFWLGSRNRLKPAYVWAVLGVGAVFWLWGSVTVDGWFDEGNYFITGLILAILFKYWVALEAAHRFNHDRQSGALELLLSTPLEVPEIIHGQLQALKRQFFWPVVITLVMHFVFILSEGSSSLVSWWLTSMALLVADLLAICYLGMWLGLKGRYANRAFGLTIALILFLPWLVIIGFLTCVSVFGNSGFSGSGDNMFLGVWLMTGLGVDIAFGVYARNALHERLRDLAASRFDSAPVSAGR